MVHILFYCYSLQTDHKRHPSLDKLLKNKSKKCYYSTKYTCMLLLIAFKK